MNKIIAWTLGIILTRRNHERGWGMGAIRVFGLEEEKPFHLVNRLVWVTGIYEAGRGLTIETLTPVDQG